MNPIITSILDNDLYKFTMLNAVLKLYPNQQVEYTFCNRDKREIPTVVYSELARQIRYMEKLSLTQTEEIFLRDRFSHIFDEDFFEYLRNFKFNSDQVKLEYFGQALKMTIHGSWESTILWEVPLMAILSEVFFKKTIGDVNLANFKTSTFKKGETLNQAKIPFMEFGTRRRFSKLTQTLAVSLLKMSGRGYMEGTSNVYLGMMHNVPVKGTVAHEWIMYHGATFGYTEANNKAIQAWREVYGDNLNVLLPDTYTTKSFLETVTEPIKTVRQDSGDPLLFTSKMHMHFRENAKGKTILYSDGLTVDKVLEINAVESPFEKKFAIGTHFTNDIEGTTPLNIVIKMSKANGIPTVKLSDVEGKNTGDSTEIEKCKKELKI